MVRGFLLGGRAMNQIVNVGIIGAGRIAKKFAEGIEAAPEARLYAIAARDLERAKVFGETYGAEKVYGSYEEMLQDEKVDIVYISTPNGLHKEHALLCIKHNKHVICEKPFTANARELEEVIAAAKEHDVFLIEAMWTRFFPVIKQVRALVEQGTLGQIQQVQADFGFSAATRDSIKFDPALAGGAVMDVGNYPISLASMFLKQQPQMIKAVATVGDTGIDERTSMMFEYANGAQALLNCAITLQTPRNAYIVGEKGFIHIPNPWFATQATVTIHEQEAYDITCEDMKNGYHFELEEAISCIRKGEKESSLMTLAESLELMHTLDRVRSEIGVKCPADL